MMRVQQTTGAPGLEVVEPDGSVIRIHPLWLRERCSDPRCMDARTGQRLYDPSDIDPTVSVATIVNAGLDCWRATFSDGMSGLFQGEAILRELRAPDAQSAAPRLWDSSLSVERLRWDWNASPATLKRYLDVFMELGFVVFTDVSLDPGSVLEVARAFGKPRDTNFGLLFDVKNKPSPTDLAYTGLGLDAHTDNPYRDPVPGVQLLHCLVNESSGGFSTLVDGRAVVNALGAEDPRGLALLASTKVRFSYRDEGTELEHLAPIVELDERGALSVIRFSPRLDFVPLAPYEKLSAFYAARRRLDRMLRSNRFQIEFLLNPGDLVMFDNRRLLHGRTAFDSSRGERHLQGCYLDIDGVVSLHRVVTRKNADRLAASLVA